MTRGKTLFLIIALLPCLAFSGCLSGQMKSEPVSFTSEFVPIKFQFPAGWFMNRDEHPFDLQCFSKDRKMNSGVFGFKRINLASGSTPENIFLDQIDNLRSLRDNFELFEPEETSEVNGLFLTTVTFIGEKGHSKYCYRFTLIEFEKEGGDYAIVLQISSPGDWENSEPIFKSIISSAQLMKNAEGMPE